MTERRTFATIEARNRAIIALAQEGVTPTEIEERIDAGRGTIYVTISLARKSGVEIPYFSTRGRKRASAGDSIDRYGKLNVRRELFEALAEAAKPRGMSASALASRLLEAIVDDNLYNAVLDA